MPVKLIEIVPPAVIKAGLPASSIPDLFAAITVGTPAALAKVPGINPQIEAVLGAALSTAYAAAYAYVYYAAVAVGQQNILQSNQLSTMINTSTIMCPDRSTSLARRS